MEIESLALQVELGLQALNGGLFVSRGVGVHPRRTLASSELIFVRKGALSIRENQTDFRVEAGQSLVLRAGHLHEGTAPYTPELSFFWLHFTFTPLTSSTELTVPQYVAVERPDYLTTLFRRFLEEQEGGTLTPLSRSLLLALMLCELSRSRVPAGGRLASGAELAGRADAHIRAHFHHLTAGQLAQELGFNANYLSRVYRETYGKTPTETIQQCRLRLARQLLLEGENNIDEIARACGFEDTGYFRRLFKREEGVTPRVFRRLYARTHTNTH